MALPLHQKWRNQPVLVVTRDGRYYIGEITAVNKSKITLHGAVTTKKQFISRRVEKGNRYKPQAFSICFWVRKITDQRKERQRRVPTIVRQARSMGEIAAGHSIVHGND